MFSKRVLMLSITVLAAVVIVGCAPTMVGTNMGVYRAGKMYSVSDKSMEAVYEATLSAMDKLQLKVTEKMKDVFAAKVVAVPTCCLSLSVSTAIRARTNPGIRPKIPPTPCARARSSPWAGR